MNKRPVPVGINLYGDAATVLEAFLDDRKERRIGETFEEMATRIEDVVSKDRFVFCIKMLSYIDLIQVTSHETLAYELTTHGNFVALHIRAS